MTITQLTYVLALNEHKNFTKAAKACMISQPSLSMQIQKLEEELKISLFNSCLLYTSPSPRDCRLSRMPSSA